MAKNSFQNKYHIYDAVWRRGCDVRERTRIFIVLFSSGDRKRRGRCALAWACCRLLSHCCHYRSQNNKFPLRTRHDLLAFRREFIFLHRISSGRVYCTFDVPLVYHQCVCCDLMARWGGARCRNIAYADTKGVLHTNTHSQREIISWLDAMSHGSLFRHFDPNGVFTFRDELIEFCGNINLAHTIRSAMFGVPYSVYCRPRFELIICYYQPLPVSNAATFM